jgi:hypothetical protein
MSQKITFMQQLANVLWCNRRNSSSDSINLKGAPRVGAKIGKKNAASLGYRSNESTDLDSDPATLSTSGSDMETTSSVLRAHRPSIGKPPPGLSGPPGLEALGGHSLQKRRGASYAAGKGSNAEAKQFVPTPVGKDSDLEERLREITSSSGSDAPSSLQEFLKRRLQREQSAPPKASLPTSLQQVLGKLTAEDAAIVKAAFQSHEASRKAGAPNAPRFPRVANITEDNTLRANLRKLATIDSKRVFMVRKIAKLGLNSPDLLRKYFSTFGSIEHVFVTHSIDKRNVDPNDPEAQPMIRPAGVGFIVMEKIEDVVNIFSKGLEHKVSGVLIALTAYEHHDPQETARNESTFGLQPSNDDANRPKGPRFPTYANITEDNTLRSNLQKMSEIDADRIFMVRKINKLGLGSVQLLKTHFRQFGNVSNVYVTHSIDRRNVDQNDPSKRPAVRPAGIGFVVMES